MARRLGAHCLLTRSCAGPANRYKVCRNPACKTVGSKAQGEAGTHFNACQESSLAFVPDYISNILPFHMEAGTACAIDKQLMRDAVANVSSGRMRPHQFLKSIREHQASINVSLELAYYTASASQAASNLSVVEGRRYRTPEWRDHNHISGHGALPRIVNDHLRARGELSDKLMESTLLDKSRVLAGDATFKVATLMRVDSGKSGVFSNVYTLMAGDGGETMLLYAPAPQLHSLAITPL